MKPLEVGCIAEVLPRKWHDSPEENALRDSWTGRRVAVTGFGRVFCRVTGRVEIGVMTVPNYHGHMWLVESLRRIDPPDWEAPRIQEKELTT